MGVVTRQDTPTTTPVATPPTRQRRSVGGVATRQDTPPTPHRRRVSEGSCPRSMESGSKEELGDWVASPVFAGTPTTGLAVGRQRKQSVFVVRHKLIIITYLLNE